ncbi:ketopantoate reductase family protein [Cohnella zeiphila]|uniref:2-dehydropantoate 2-reductase n=1 Tax=Cohnella zeiphila TaxID=2761120 RepID=A0A7X0VV98_9BACL|nr:2-dehydropantoate 2-reductase [Cohnella zeiphila]MBB6729668.1 2-dehydropantoate 2-reductase [Cohnella zeiphila]
MARFVVVGGGSLGLLLAGKLAMSDCDVEVWTRSKEQAARIAAEGIAIGDASGSVYAAAKPIRAAALADARPLPDGDAVVLLAVKQTAIGDALLSALAAAVPPGAALVAFCNGIGHVERLAEALPGRDLAAAITTEAALRTDARTVLHTGSGHTFVGPATMFDRLPPYEAEGPGRERLSEVQNRLVLAGFETSVSNKMTERMLRKLLVNAAINPLTALLRVRNGELTASPERLAIMRALYEETVAILRLCGLETEEPLWEELLNVCSRTAMNRSSMLQDVLAGRKTEIDALNGAVCRLAERLDKPVPRNETVVALIRALDSG